MTMPFSKVIRNQFIHHTDFIVETYMRPVNFVWNLDKKPDVIILDYHLDGIDKTQ
jgi:hypothetical protein